MLSTLIMATVSIQRFLTRMQAATVLNARAQCPSCVSADKNADRSRRARVEHGPPVLAVCTANGAVVLACVGHAPFIRQQRAHLAQVGNGIRDG